MTGSLIAHPLAAAIAIISSGTTAPNNPSQQTPKAAPNSFNPQLSIVGDFRATLKDNGPDKKKADFKEIEMGLAADADPFLRVEAFISLSKDNGDWKTDVEEAYGVYNRLGKGFQAKVGKIAGAIGRVQRNHVDQLDYLDYPLAVRDVFGDEGFRNPGASISYLLPGNRFNELTAEVLDSDENGPVFNTSSKNSLSYIGRYRTFFDFSEDISAQFGASYLNGPTQASTSRGDLYGLDYTMKWRPGSVGRSANMEAEGYWTKPGGASKRTFGGFARLNYEVRPRWFVTGGFDYSEIPGTSNIRRGWLAGLTLKVTEFQHWRVEYQTIQSNFSSTRRTLNLQFEWVIGAHPAHKY